jgi:uncharacterized protein (UPF0264 family)
MKRHINILIGCNEPLVVEALRILVGTAAQGGKIFDFRVRSRCDEFIQQAVTSGFEVAIMHANCLVPARPLTLFEQALLAVRNIMASGSLRLVVLTTMDEWVSPLRDSGADVCLKAPFAANELLAVVTTPL